MVAHVTWYVVATAVAVLGQTQGGQLSRLPSAARARILGALFLLTIGCIAFVTLTWLALRIGRRHLRRLDEGYERRWTNLQADDWAKKPLAPRPPAQPDTDDE
jgi:hypothetical protein